MTDEDFSYKLATTVSGTTLIAIARGLTHDGLNPEYDRALVELITEALGLSHNEHGDDIEFLVLGDRATT